MYTFKNTLFKIVFTYVSDDIQYRRSVIVKSTAPLEAQKKLVDKWISENGYCESFHIVKITRCDLIDDIL